MNEQVNSDTDIPTITIDASVPTFQVGTPNLGFERDSNGLVKGVEYKFKKTGYRKVIDWRGMILPEHLVFNKQYQKEIEDRYGKTLDLLNVTEVEDKYLLILLPGIKELAALRGFLNVDPTIKKSEINHASVECSITWMPNFESSREVVTFGDVGNATLDNTSGFAQLYLETIAYNRAFVRAVRNYLGINIVVQDEVGGKPKNNKDFQTSQNNTVAFSPNALLANRAQEKGITFDAFKKRVIEGYRDRLSADTNPEAWKSFLDLENKDAQTLLTILKDA